MIKKLTINPAKILKINRGTLGEGAFADAVILDLHNERVETVMVNGKIVLFNGKLTGEKGGKRIRFKS
jgi:imidazolonepropionase-like amidohydrolase